MVLGALSVGASVFVPPTVVEGQERAAQSPIFTERDSSNSATDTNSDGDAFTTQHTLVPNTLTQPKTVDKPAVKIPVKAKIKAKTGLGIQFGPVNIGTGISLGTLQINADASAVAPIVNTIPEVIVPVELPNTETPAAEQVPEESPSAAEDEKSNENDTLSVTVDAAQP